MVTRLESAAKAELVTVAAVVKSVVVAAVAALEAVIASQIGYQRRGGRSSATSKRCGDKR